MILKTTWRSVLAETSVRRDLLLSIINLLLLLASVRRDLLLLVIIYLLLLLLISTECIARTRIHFIKAFILHIVYLIIEHILLCIDLVKLCYTWKLLLWTDFVHLCSSWILLLETTFFIETLIGRLISWYCLPNKLRLWSVFKVRHLFIYWSSWVTTGVTGGPLFLARETSIPWSFAQSTVWCPVIAGT